MFALEDRCAHRQVPLHMGTVRGEEIRCMYHGWCYRGDGRLASIPFLPSGASPPHGIRSYPCTEAYGYIFVFPGDAATPPPLDIPELELTKSRRHTTMYYHRKVACAYSFMHENLMDMTHQHMHGRILGRIIPTLLSYRRGDTWVTAKYRFEDAGGGKHWGEAFLGRGSRAGPSHTNGDILTIRTVYPYQTLTLAASESAEPDFHLWVVYVPADKQQRTNVTCGSLMIRKPALPVLMYLLKPFIRHFAESVFAEDRRAVEAEQRAYDEQGADWNVEVSPLLLDLRDVLVRNGVPLP